MKKKLTVFALCLTFALALVACGKKEEAPSKEAEKDFVGDEYSDTGEGTFYLVNQSGSTENGNVIVVYASADTALTQIELDTSGINGGALSYVYIDGMLATKGQYSDSQASLDLKDDALSVGEHKVELVQYTDDATDGEVTVYKSCSYEVKEG